MASQHPEQPGPDVVIIDPETGQPATREALQGALQDRDDDGPKSPTALVEEPAKVMRIGRMIQHLLEEVKAAPLDEAGRTRLASLLHTSVKELKQGLAPELDAELDRLVEPFESKTPTESELRIAQATLAGWLEGLFHGIQSAIYVQQMTARAQLEEMRALPPGAMPGMERQHQQGQDESGSDERSPGSSGGMYL